MAISIPAARFRTPEDRLARWGNFSDYADWRGSDRTALVEARQGLQQVEKQIADLQEQQKVRKAFRELSDDQEALKTAEELAEMRTEAEKKATTAATMMRAAKERMLAEVEVVKADLAYRQAHVQLMSLLGKHESH
jgi:hypothetical protein